MYLKAKLPVFITATILLAILLILCSGGVAVGGSSGGAIGGSGSDSGSGGSTSAAEAAPVPAPTATVEAPKAPKLPTSTNPAVNTIVTAVTGGTAAQNTTPLTIAAKTTTGSEGSYVAAAIKPMDCVTISPAALVTELERISGAISSLLPANKIPSELIAAANEEFGDDAQVLSFGTQTGFAIPVQLSISLTVDYPKDTVLMLYKMDANGNFIAVGNVKIVNGKAVVTVKGTGNFVIAPKH